MSKGKWYTYLFGILSILILWHLISYMVNLPIIPSPVKVLSNTIEIFIPKIIVHVSISTWRITTGIAIAIILGMPIGLFMGYFKTLDVILSPMVYLTYPIPKIALLPIVMLLFGLGDFSKTMMIILIVIFQIIVSVRDGVKSISEETYYPLISLGAGYFDLFKEIILPASLPNIFTSLRIAMATAISILFFTETFGTEYGMGYFIMDAWMRINYIEMYSGILVLSLMGLTLFLMIDFCERLLCPWIHNS